MCWFSVCEMSLAHDYRWHKGLMRSLYGDYVPNLVRWRHPVFIDKESVDPVPARLARGTWDTENYRSPKAYVIVVHTRW